MRFHPGRLAGLAAAVAANAAFAAPYTFMVYGDSRAGDDCRGNAVHALIVKRMVAANPAFVVNTGDMITGYSAATNFAARGVCPLPQNGGSLKEIIAPLQERKPPAGLPTAFFPVIGNHDDNWGSKWYPDKAQGGICDAFDMRALVPNHTSKPYFKARRSPIVSDEQFHNGMCSTSEQAIYPRYAYYSFDYENAHFVVMRANNNNFNLEQCSRCQDPQDYSDYYNIHQLHWLEHDLEAASKNPKVKHIFVFIHAVMFGSGEQHTNVASQKRLASLFTQYGVKMAFSGHTHAYERTVGIVAGANAPEGEKNDERGTVYVTTGGGGSPLHAFKPQPWYTAFRKTTYHYLEITVDGEGIRARVLDPDNRVIEEFRR